MTTPPLTKVCSLLVVTSLDGIRRLLVCQRGPVNQDGQPQSFAGLLQPICHGGMETDESPEVAIARELREETGDAFAAAVMAVGLRRLADIGSLAAFVAEVPAEALQALELGGEFTGEVLQLSLDDLSHVRAADRTIDKPGVPPGSWVMFADHLQLAQQVLA